MEIAVVGAGLAGLCVARPLAEAGHAVCLFEKARGPGGRLSTRRSEHGGFDHGAQYFTARSAAFAEAVKSWEQAGAVARWEPRLAELKPGHAAAPVPDAVAATPRWVGAPTMSAVGKHLARGLDVRLRTRVESLRSDGERWSLAAEDDSDLGIFDAVVLAVPAPQAVPLLAEAPELAARAGEAALAPCQAVMAAWDEDLELPFDAAFVRDSPLSWVARNASKPGREDTAGWTLHASAEWSAANLEHPPEAIADALSAAFGEALGVPLPTPVHLAAHRWRFALPTRTLSEPALWDAGRRLGVCGDWCAGDRVQAAFESGSALGVRVSEALR